MRAAVFVGVDRDLEVTDLEPIAPGPSDVVIDIGAAGVCHSDLSVVTGARPFPAPALLGHEAPGTVVDVGPEVRAVGVGVNEIPALGDCLADAHLDCCLLANQLTLLNQPASDEVFAECARRGVQLIAGGVYNSGVLAGGDRYIYREHPMTWCVASVNCARYATGTASRSRRWRCSS